MKSVSEELLCKFNEKVKIRYTLKSIKKEPDSNLNFSKYTLKKIRI